MPVSLPSGLTDAQVRAIRAAARLVPEWADGLQRNIGARLERDGPWDNGTINAAILSTFNDLGLDSPFLPTT